jgi:uncharacterized membrane-anchored protein
MMRLKLAKTAALAVALMTSVAMTAAPPPPPKADDTGAKLAALKWVDGPAKPTLTERAAISLPPGATYLDSANTEELLKLSGNLPAPDHFTVAPKDLHWWSVFSFEDMGYVKDDEKIDADALLAAMRENESAANEERKKQGLETLTIVGWAVPPHYDKATHNLEYGVTIASASGQNVNYTTRLLGRAGVMTANLITGPETLNTDLVEFRKTLGGFAYTPDQSYAAYKEGDKVSEYGLAALVTGGAAAALAKGGMLKGLFALLAAGWKFIAVALFAGFAAFRNFFARLFGKGDDLGPPPADEMG